MTYPPNIVHGQNSLGRGTTSPDPYYMKVGAQLYGPYSANLMEQYCNEGRLGPQSLLSNHPDGVFKPAIEWPEFKLWSKGRFENEAEMAPNPVQPSEDSERLSQNQTRQEKPLPSVYFVIADISQDVQLTFIQTLQSLGYVHRLAEGAWILGANRKIEDIRLQLSQTLTINDHLFIHDTFSNRAGWFNLGEGLGDNIRNLWIDTAKRRKLHQNN